MHGPYVRFQLPDGRIADLGPGGIIGRLRSATLRIADPRVSEIHALVSLRGRALVMLAQRGLLEVDGASRGEVALQPGQVIRLVDGVSLRVVDVVLPAEVLVLEVDGLEPEELSAPVYSLLVTPRPTLVAAWLPTASMVLWSDGEGWSAQVPGEPVRSVGRGDGWCVGEVELKMAARPLRAAATPATRATGRVQPALRVVTRFETVHIEVPGRPTAILTGKLARIVSELAEFGVPVGWELVGRALWPEEEDLHRMRQNWDRTMRRMRKRLRELGVRQDLVRADGKGNVELVLGAGDAVVNQS